MRSFLRQLEDEWPHESQDENLLGLMEVASAALHENSDYDWSGVFVVPTSDKTYQISAEALKTLVWMARRYASGRKTYAPGEFNRAYASLPDEFKLTEQDDSRVVATFPLADEDLKK